ncbi:MAG TPA: DNA polymerase II [Steroidobacteraceae bacterium]|jgi:DNA polymerase-2|nr:DNA polymerase II [Steroidobacteraceae bacterium]
MPTARGFVFQASYRVISAHEGRRIPVVHLHGRLEDGTAFLVRDDRQRPHFYVRAVDAAGAMSLRAANQSRTEYHTFEGDPVVRIEADVPSDVPQLRDRLQTGGIETYEADVRFATRYLIERGIKGGCEIDGEPAPSATERGATGGGSPILVFDNAVLRPAEVTLEPRVLSFDIETDAKGERLLAISLFGPAVDEVLVVDARDRPMPKHAFRYESERAALDAFAQRLRAIDPDVITGWNIIDFDLSVLERIAARLSYPLHLGREPGAMRIRRPEGYFGSGQATITGRLVLDGIDLLRGAFIRMDDYSLDAVAREVLGEGKAVAGEARDRLGEIIHNYEHDLPAFALYARTDARLAYRIVEKLRLVELAFARSRLTGMTPDRVAASIASFDFLYLSELERARIVAPTVRGSDSRVHVAQQGGHVLEPVTGLHANVWLFDFKSLYPSIIRTFNIDPVGYVPGESPLEDLIETPGGKFRRAPAILPRILDELFPRREAAKKRNDDVAAHAIKILMNSFYGVLGTSACRFYNPALANSITGMGKHMLLWSKSWFESAGFDVLYGDTDSLFVSSASSDPVDAARRARELAASLNSDLARYVESRWRRESRLELEYEKLYLRLFLPRARHSTRGASKRYAGWVSDAGVEGVEFVGMEVVRRDWTALAKRVQRELYQRLFTDQPVDAYLADIVARVRGGEMDEELVYHKNLRKDTGEYTATTPPHVAAARKSSRPPGRSIRYVLTTAGAEPLDNLTHPLDREHYVEKQVRPVAEPVLETLGLDFESVIGDARQFDFGWS